jgi:hypothetical protein
MEGDVVRHGGVSEYDEKREAPQCENYFLGHSFSFFLSPFLSVGIPDPAGSYPMLAMHLVLRLG